MIAPFELKMFSFPPDFIQSSNEFQSTESLRSDFGLSST